jgi:hypothetical protein
MSLKVAATLLIALSALATVAQGAMVEVNDVTIVPGDPRIIQVPILISPSSPSERIGAMNISFAAGTLADAIPIIDADPQDPDEEFDGSIWEQGTFFGDPGTPSVHSVTSAVAILSPLEIVPNGTLVTYTLDTTALPLGMYSLNPNFAGTTAKDGQLNSLALTFSPGVLKVVPEPSVAALLGTFFLMVLSCARRRADSPSGPAPVDASYKTSGVANLNR